MIVPESTPKSPPKGDREPLLADGQAIPPAYSQYQSFPPFPDQQPQPPPVSAQRRESTAARFFKALVVGVLIWFLFGMLTSSFVWVADRRHGHSRVSDCLLRAIKGCELKGSRCRFRGQMATL